MYVQFAVSADPTPALFRDGSVIMKPEDCWWRTRYQFAFELYRVPLQNRLELQLLGEGWFDVLRPGADGGSPAGAAVGRHQAVVDELLGVGEGSTEQPGAGELTAALMKQLCKQKQTEELNNLCRPPQVEKMIFNGNIKGMLGVRARKKNSLTIFVRINARLDSFY